METLELKNIRKLVMILVIGGLALVAPFGLNLGFGVCPGIAVAAESGNKPAGAKQESKEKKSDQPCQRDETTRWSLYKEAIQKADQEEKPIVLFFHANSCAPCAALEKNGFNDPDVACYLNHKLVGSKLQFEDSEQEIEEYGVTFTPTIVFLTPKAQTIAKVVGYQEPEDLLLMLKYVGEKAYLEMTFEEWLEKQKK